MPTEPVTESNVKGFKIFVFAEKRVILLGAMNFNRLLRAVLKFLVFFGTLACIMVLIFHIQTRCVTESSRQTKTVYNSCCDSPDITDDSRSSTLLPIMDFKELESKKKLSLLIIVSTAPGRFKRRQAIRDTWWKHCNGSQVTKKKKKTVNSTPKDYGATVQRRMSGNSSSSLVP